MRGWSIILALALVAAIFFIFPADVSAASISASTDRIIYLSNDTITITGTGANDTNMTATFYNSLNVAQGSNVSLSDGAGSFTIYYDLNNTDAGDYYAVVSDGTDSARMDFRVVSTLIYLEVNLIGDTEPIGISTNITMNAGNATAMGGNVSELIGLSLSDVVHYGNYSNLTGNNKNYSFVLVDQYLSGVYDTVYVDDDENFLLYNISEDNGTSSDPEQILKMGEKFKDLIIGHIDMNSGNLIVLVEPVTTNAYSVGSDVHFVVVARDDNGEMIPGIDISLELKDSAGTVHSSDSGTTDGYGKYKSNFTAPSTTGEYKISVNDSLGVEFFMVESFKLKGKVTDLSGNPAFVFAPNPKVKITAVSKLADGTLVNLTSSSFVLKYPNGSTTTFSLSYESDGIYSKELDMNGASEGFYGVDVSGTYSGDTQYFMIGFEIRAVQMEVMAVNMDFIDQADSGAGMVSAFAPNTNVTLITLLANVSGGGMQATGPEGMSLIDIDNSSTFADECPSLVRLLEVRDDTGKLYSVNATIMNLTNALALNPLPPEDEGPPQNMMTQCVVMFEAPDKTANYKASIQVNNSGSLVKGAAIFGVQSLIAKGESVDFNGDNFWFYAPNSTLRIKLKIQDLATREEIPAANITDAKIIGIVREFPTFEDVFTDSYRAVMNESIENGTLIFTSPNSEGFFSLKFKFKAIVNTTPQEGIGKAAFMLKKYMIWAEPQCQMGGFCIFGTDDNITLRVSIVDIDKGSILDSMGKDGGSSLLTCTDCTGLTVSIDKLFNDQLFKEIPSGDYNVAQGYVVNSSATVGISPGPNGLPTGWYGVDIVVNDTQTGDTYFGWGGFEIRNFWVDTIAVDFDGENYTASRGGEGGGATTFESGSDILFTVIPRNPSNWNMLSQTQAPEVQNINWMISQPPASLDFDYSTSLVNVTFVEEWGAETYEAYVINITGIQSVNGYCQANTKVYTNLGTDIGSLWFDMSTYKLDMTYRGMEEWPVVFSNTENLTVNFTATDFDDNPHNITNSTKLRYIFEMKTDSPRKLNSTTNCNENLCTVDADLSSLQQGGKYMAEFRIVDENGVSKEEMIEFETRGLVVSIAALQEMYVGSTDTWTKEINIDNDRDQCANNLQPSNDNTQMPDYNLGDESSFSINHSISECPADDTVVCLYGGSLNMSFGSSVTGNLFGGYACVLPNGSFITQYVSDPSDCLANSGTPIFAATNGTDLWVNSTGQSNYLIDMSGIVPNITGDTVDIGFRNWQITTVLDFNNDTVINDTLLVRRQDRNLDIAVSQRYLTNKLVTSAYNLTTGGWMDSGGWDSVQSGAGWEQWYFVSNTTHIWANTTNILNGAPLTEGDSFTTGDGATWIIVDVGMSQGGPEPSRFRMLQNTSYYMLVFDGGMTNITVAGRYGQMYGGHYCVSPQGQWNMASPGQLCSQMQAEDLYLIVNDTALWFNTTNSTVGSMPYYENDTILNLSDKNWSIDSISCGSGNCIVELSSAQGYVCGRAWSEYGDENIQIVAPVSSTNVYFGKVSSLRQTQYANWLGPLFNVSRPVYIFHNTSSVWMWNTTNLTTVTGYTVGETMTDPYGGQWLIKAIKNNKVTLKGLNVLAETGIYVNTSLSKSGTFKFEKMREEYLGGFNKNQGSKSGLDMDGDSYTNGSFYVAISDSQSSGVYDTMFFSTTDNFTIPMSVSGSWGERNFGNNDSLWLLGISAGAERVICYANTSGEWSDLGDYNINGNIRIPVFVTEPSGALTEANISVEHIRVKSSGQNVFHTLTGSIPNATISGIGELLIQNISGFGFGTGEYVFELKAQKDATIEKLEEWRWPRATMRSFLVQTQQGFGGYVTDFYEFPLARYDWSNSKIERRLRQDARNASNVINGVLTDAQTFDYSQCVPPALCGASWGINCSIMRRSSGGTDEYFIFNNESGDIYRNDTSCNFTGAETTFSLGDGITLSMENGNYTVKILDASVYHLTNCGGPCWRIDFGLPGIDEATLSPLRNDSQQMEWPYEWGFLHNVSIFGTLYDIVIGSDDSLPYPQAENWNMNEYSEKAMFTSNGNFTGITPVIIGENFTNDLYLARVGPGLWEGVVVGNFTNLVGLGLPMYPGIDARLAMNDATSSYFGVIDEYAMDLDLNVDGELNETFYIVTYDQEDDGETVLTNFLLDDDLNITEEWWNNMAQNEEDKVYYDFYDNESGIYENQGNLPTGIWKGDLRFGADIDNVSWEYQPRWEIEKYSSGDSMLLKKNRWNLNITDNVTFILRAYNFNQTALSGANVSLDSLMRMSFMGAQEYVKGVHYNVEEILNMTNSDGYAIFKIYPLTGTWSEGDYIASFAVNGTYSTERTDAWFRIGQEGGQ
ncbi:MAG: hypothetical protein JW716_04615 [Candidatus Aenigmarchaeota archaeon]|nr:hypothetical protein [Candidatus Aenigmarchaeota archaeon]